jgi:ribosome biogenesis GTPase
MGPLAGRPVLVGKKKKVRVALKKNRQKRTRANDLTRTYETHGQGKGQGETAPTERVRAKGDLSRHRTIVADVHEVAAGESTDEGAEDVASRRSVDTSTCLPGRVVRSHGLLSFVETDDGRTYPCHVRRLLKSLAIDGRNVVTVGDRVWFRPAGAGGEEGLVEKVEARKGMIVRGYRHRQHVIASNVDVVLIVSALAEPGLKLSLIDRYLVAAEIGGVRPVIVLNKADLVDMALYQWVVGLYSQLGYETVVTSAADGRGLDRLRSLLAQGVTAVSGQSGVGKSSLLNAIQPGLNLKVREVSDWTAKGKHTTTSAELIRLELGGYVVDTPGLRQFELWGVVPGELEGHFIEFRPYIPRCRFPDCSHTHETRCAVKEALHWGQIHAGRYESYVKLFEQRPFEGE